MDWKIATHVLKFPVTVGDMAAAAVTLREPDVEALEAIDELGIVPGAALRVKQMRGIIEALGDAPPEVIGKLHRDDLAALGELLGPLLDGGEPEVTAS